MKNAFDGLICRLYRTEERIQKLEDMPIETVQIRSTEIFFNEKKH